MKDDVHLHNQKAPDMQSLIYHSSQYGQLEVPVGHTDFLSLHPLCLLFLSPARIPQYGHDRYIPKSRSR